MPADSTIQTALIVIAVASSIQTVLLLCTVIAMAIAWRRAQAMVEERLGVFAARMDEVASQTRIAVSALQGASAQVNGVVRDAAQVVRTITSAIAAPRNLLIAGAASAASAWSRWRRARRRDQQPYGAPARS